MHIRQVTLTVPDPSETSAFLASTFDFPLVHHDDGDVLTIGASRLRLIEGTMEPDGYYHLAFDIPENEIVEGRDLLATRIPVLEGGDHGIVTGAPVWNSHSVYFNAPGNLNLELIGRHRLANAITGPFSFSHVLHISEVGIAVDDPLLAVRQVQDQTGLAPFGEPSESFAPIGSDDGLLILVKRGRIWLPTTDQTTTQRPLRIEIVGLHGELHLGTSCTLIGIDPDRDEILS